MVLDPTAPTKALLSVNGCQICVCVWEDDDYLIHDSVSYSAMLLIYLSLWLFSCCTEVQMGIEVSLHVETEVKGVDYANYQ